MEVSKMISNKYLIQLNNNERKLLNLYGIKSDILLTKDSVFKENTYACQWYRKNYPGLFEIYIKLGILHSDK
jgi:hypothetical protein